MFMADFDPVCITPFVSHNVIYGKLHSPHLPYIRGALSRYFPITQENVWLICNGEFSDYLLRYSRLTQETLYEILQ